MDSFKKLQELCYRLDHLEKTGESLCDELNSHNEVVAQSGKLILTLTEDIRTRAMELVSDLEREALSNRSFYSDCGQLLN